MVLVDTSIWVSHFREGSPKLKALLEKGEVICHPFIIGELACGNLKNRKEILTLLHALPMASLANHEEVLQFIEERHLMGLGLDYVDVHLLASALLSQSPLWIKDKKLREAAKKLNILFRFL